MAKIVTLTFDDDDNPIVETEGYVGSGCDAVQKAFADAIGSTIKKQFKPEYHKAPVKKVSQTGSR
jgi:hypothetical protein